MAESMGLVRVMDYMPNMLPWRAKIPEDASIAGCVQYLNSMWRRVDRATFPPINLGAPDLLEALKVEDAYQHVRQRTEQVFNSHLKETVANFFESHEGHVSEASFLISRTESPATTPVSIEADRLLVLLYQQPDEDIGFLYLIPIFFKIEKVDGENPHVKRKFYPALSNPDSITFLFYNRKKKDFFLPVERTARIPIIASRSMMEMVYSCCDVKREYPVAAATWLADKLFYVDRPGRHHDIVLSEEFQKHKSIHLDAISIQGFVTNHRNFVSRRRAMLLATREESFLDPISTQIAKEMPFRYSEELRLSTQDPKELLDLKFMGIHQIFDLERKGYAMMDTFLFSEDLW